MRVIQSIQDPHGITVFGSAIVRVIPDVASLQFSVASTQLQPEPAFQKVKDLAKQVRKFLNASKIDDVGTSQIQLSESFDYRNQKREFLGYTASIRFHILLHKLGRTEDILTGLVKAGVTNIGNLDYQTTRLKELRVEARQRAVQAAREKALLYCEAAGVKLGRVLHIEDVNPDDLRQHEGHTIREAPTDDNEPPRAFDPSSIVVSGAVMIAYAIE